MTLPEGNPRSAPGSALRRLPGLASVAHRHRVLRRRCGLRAAAPGAAARGAGGDGDDGGLLGPGGPGEGGKNLGKMGGI